MLSAELLYDLINLFAYYIRVVIQSARLVLMLTAIGSYQELVLLDNIMLRVNYPYPLSQEGNHQ